MTEVEVIDHVAKRLLKSAGGLVKDFQQLSSY